MSLFFLLLLCVVSGNLSLYVLEFVLLAVEFFHTCIPLLGVATQVEETKVVLVGLDLIVENVQLTNEASTDVATISTLDAFLEAINAVLGCILVGKSIEAIHLLTKQFVEFVLFLKWYVTNLVPLLLCLTKLCAEITLKLLRHNA